MFIGHFGLGMGLKKTAPAISLGTFFIAVQLLDLIWPTFLLLHIEHVIIHPELSGNRILEFKSYPYTHSLIGALCWSLLFGGIYFLVKKNGRNALILGLAVFSHWVLDFFVHFGDLPLLPTDNSTHVGLALWGSPAVEIVIEVILFVAGIVLYLRSVQFKNTLGKIVFGVLIALFVLVQLSSSWGPAPANETALAWSAQFQWLFVLLAYWVDRNTLKTA
ncbi:hypothetical protein A4H97_10435 [Niastella yeongjuensis]|uniref:Permease n=1 Tax=Niastella yeongjuensis TaxID=354355 RepID=A0A1V9EF76_9BACT|nr:hypothetical protein [Niastella yeongjuensis]OQP44770.1 hypothetical protein A4H97_10435 [Niastella yeongjuensis]SEP42557.1 hypothetical protein SAMN05660816_06014 [Niastella yeongjuensis]